MIYYLSVFFISLAKFPFLILVFSTPLVNELEILTPPERKVTIAVYSFSDKTGQRKPSENLALLSTAVTQGAEVWLIQALKKAGNGEWFQVIERMISCLTIPVQVGGGIRTESNVLTMMDIGVNRVVLGTIAVENKELVRSIVCLLYTSPSPRDATLSRMPSSA